MTVGLLSATDISPLTSLHHIGLLSATDTSPYHVEQLSSMDISLYRVGLPSPEMELLSMFPSLELKLEPQLLVIIREAADNSIYTIKMINTDVLQVNIQ